jgi:hypothetical protein
LTFAAVWLGGLNQDEGWYLYAAKLCAEGKVLYRDFFYTQAPVMPIVYSAFVRMWDAFGVLGGRIVTVLIGLASILFACATALRMAPKGRGSLAALTVFLLLGSNLYHLYYVAIPKTYALASLFLAMGFYFLCLVKAENSRVSKTDAVFAFFAGVAMAFAAGTRISIGAVLAVVGVALLLSVRRFGLTFLFFALGGAITLALVYGPFLADAQSRAGLFAAQAYHAARGGFDPVFTVGSLSRLVRWYLPLFIVLGLGSGFRRGGVAGMMLWSFAAVFAVQMLAPFPYEDYQVPVMCLPAVFAAVGFVSGGSDERLPRKALLVLGLAWASSFGSPLLEKWMTNGQDRFWTRKKEKCELAQLREVAKIIEAEDPGGKTLLTQDLYLAVETGRKVPDGLEMGPFSMLSDSAWRRLLTSAPCEIAALSLGYTFTIAPPECGEVPFETQCEYWRLLKRDYELVMEEREFGQNATSLLILKRKRMANAKEANQ